MSHSDRLRRLADRLDQPLLVTQLANVRYLTGFSGSNAQLLVGADGATFLTDGRYAEVAEALVAELPDTGLEVYRSGMMEALRAALGGYAQVGVEADHVSWATVRRLAESAELIPTSGVVEDLRRSKDPTEIAALQRAADAGDRAFDAIDELRHDVATERELGWALVETMRSHGAAQAGWEPIVASGPNAARPHHRAGTDDLGGGLLLLDYGCVVDGYHSDMSRTIWLDGRPDAEIERMYRATLEAQEAGVQAVAPGVSGRDVDEACRVVLREHGYEERFLHSTGHGVGLEIHEAPRLARTSDDVLREGDVVTVEPGVYVPGLGGVRIEDMVLVTQEAPVVLTRSSKELRVP